MIPEMPENLPERLLRELKSHSQSFIVVHFNKDGLPILNINAPTFKDFLALERLIMEYGVSGLPLPDNIQSQSGGLAGPHGSMGEDEEDTDGDGWKHDE